MIINYLIDSNDQFTPDAECRIVNFSKSDSFSFTFWNDITPYPKWFDHTAIDLLYISMAVFAADRLCLRDDAQDAWSREFDLHIPVLAFESWQNCRDLLQSMLSFLSGDYWRFHFRKRQLSQREIAHKERSCKSKMAPKNYDRVCMFSGGMDSFIGAIDLMETAQIPTLFVSHYGGGKGTKEYQDKLKKEFIDHYNLENRDFRQYYAKVTDGMEDTTRTRSFMFFSHAIALATALENPVDLIIPENGVISLNIPSTFSRIGTSSTRTTHPHYIKLFQSLLDQLNLHITLKNPYQFKTKGEMLIECRNQVFMQSHINQTMSCSHPDAGRMTRETAARHCGYCLPCVIRQAALKRAKINDNSSYRDSAFNSVKEAKTILNSYKLGLLKHNPKYAFMTIQQSGRIENNINEYAELYVRGMNELRDYIEGL